MSKDLIPRYHEFFNPVLAALNDLGGSGTITEIDRRAAEHAGVTEEAMAVVHNHKKGGQSEVSYRIAWARTYLKKYGLLENSARGVWALTGEAADKTVVEPDHVVAYVRALYDKNRDDSPAEDDSADAWRQELREVLIAMKADAFERLAQRLLREAGFIQVEVTGRSGDGGIDGKGILRLGGLLGFNVIFQCKKYADSVGPGHVRDFRGAMIGRADKGLLITTGTFTQGAVLEAARDGAPAIDLVDGDMLAEMLKQFGLGISTETVEQVHIDRQWFLDR